MTGTLLLDCDGVLADFVGHMIDRLAQVGHVVLRTVTDYDFLRGFGPGVREASLLLLEDPAHWAAIPPFPETRAAVDEIRRAGHEVVVVTSPWLSCDSWCSVRRKWLKRHFDIEPGNVIVTSRKELVTGHVFIDDRLASVSAWFEADHGHAYLMERSWTAKDDWPHRFRWDPESVNEIISRLDRANNEGINR